MDEYLRLKEIIEQTFKGGEGSGNFGHEGRPGEVGGSSSEGSNGESRQEKLQGFRWRINNIFEKAGIPIKDIVVTGSTTIVKLHGEKHAEKVKNILERSGWKNVRIFSDEPDNFGTPGWRVGARNPTVF